MTSQARPPQRPSSTPGDTGHLTAQMRAAATGARPRAPVLRAAVVRAGKIVEERLLPRGADLTVGPTERNTFVVPASHQAASVRLFTWSGAGYRIDPSPGMTGRVATSAGVVDLSFSSGPLSLGPDARGKLVIGDTTLLFHFVEPPAPPPRARLPLAAQKGLLDDLDWRTTFIAAFSFLVHFGALGSLYADWSDAVLDDDVRVAQVVQILRELPPPPLVETPPKDETPTDAPAKVADAAPTKPSAAGRSAGPARGSAGGPERGGRMSESAADSIARALESSDAAIVLAIGARGGKATDRVLEAGQLPMGMIDGAAASAGGVSAGNVAGLNLGGNTGGVVRPGAMEHGGLPIDGHADGRADDTGRHVEVKRPPATTSVSPPTVSGGDVTDATQVVSRMQAGLRRCYKRALDEDPTAHGSLRVTARIGPNGEVTSAHPSGSATLPSSMMACVQRVVQSGQFTVGGSGGATLVIPMTFLLPATTAP